MNRLSRSTAVKTAAVLSFINSAFNVIASLPFITRGVQAAVQNNQSPPYFIMMLALILGVIGMVAAYGTWKLQRWGIVLTILVNLVNGLSAMPGIIFRPTPFLFVSATVTVVVSIVIIVLCLWRDPKTASVGAASQANLS
jgi:uncharacterized membrane protein (DUF2068 family)